MGWIFTKGDPKLNWKRLFTTPPYFGEDPLDIKLDRPMILNGLRVALGEIEAILNQQPEIQSSYVRALDPDSEAPRLVAYVIPAQAGQDARHMLARMKRILPMHLLPEQFVLVDELPRAAGGRVDESRLPVPEPVARDESVSQSRGERFLIKLWREMFARDSVTADDDFFALGGTDESALRMLARIESSTGVKISLEELRANSSLRALAGILDRARPVDSGEAIIELRPGQTDPIFLIPAAARTSLSAMRYVSRIRDGVRVIGVEYPRVLPPLPAPRRVPALAKYFIEQIRAIQPKGPYSLIGNCMGGVLVYEVAQQLKQAGQSVDRVIVVDCAAPKLQTTRSARGPAHSWRRFVQLVQSGRLFKAIQGRITRSVIKPVQRQFNLDLDIRRAIKYLWDAKTSYRAGSRYNDSLLVILNSLSRETERGTRWSDVAPRAELHFIEDTDHLDLFQSDRALDQVGELINAHLEHRKDAS